MNLQESIIKEYKERFGEVTKRKISEHTGIQISRVFRILSGSPMKLEEYEKFRNCISSNNENKYHLEELSKKCCYHLSPESIEDIIKFMDRRLRLSKLKVINSNNYRRKYELRLINN